MKIDDKKERSLLKLISEESREKLFAIGNEITLKKGEILFAEREEVKSLYIVIDGFMALYRSSRYGEIKVIFICTDGEAINEVVLQDEKTSICSKALTDTKLLVIHQTDLMQLCQTDYSIMINLYESLARKTRRLYHQVGNANGTYSLEKRLAAKIWKLARDYGKETASGKEIGFETTVTFLANMLGAKRETVSRIISQFKKDGIIEHNNGVLTVIDMDLLEETIQ